MNKSVPVLMGLLAAGATGAAAAHDGGQYDSYGRRDNGRDFGSGAYVGLSVGQLRYSEDGLGAITPATAMLVIGAPISANLAIEGRLGGGLSRAETNTYGLEVRSLYAGYLKGSLPLSPGFSLYGLGGVAGVDLKRDFGLIEAHDTGLSYGLGMDFQLDGGATLNVEWTRLATGNNLGYDYHVDLASIGVAWHF